MQRINVQIEGVLYPREGQERDNDFVILRTSQGICKGSMKWIPRVGEKLVMSGDFGTYKGNQEFKFKDVYHDIPADPRALLHYACELTKGLGPAMEETIWNKLGENWQNITPDDVPRMKQSAYENLQETIQHLGVEKDKTDAVTYLISIGCTRNLSEKAWSEWKTKTITLVQENPFILADLPNYSFRDVDTGIRQRFGIMDHDSRRVKAAVRYFMNQLCDGPTVASWWSLRDKVMQYAANLPNTLLCEIVHKMFESEELVAFPKTQCIATHDNFVAEKQIYDYVRG